MKTKTISLLIALLFILAALHAQSNQGYYRFPAINVNYIIFTAEGDLWKADIQGGAAQRLSTHPGQEIHPAISPDGTRIAFTAHYDGAAEVYSMPVTGGLPRRITFNGEGSTVIGWTDNEHLLYATRHFSTLPNSQLVKINVSSGEFEIIPLSQASDGTYDASGQTLFFTRLPFQGSYTKRYKGGTAQNIWKLEAGSEEALPLTSDFDGTSKTPMWYDDRVYFASDRDGSMNIWSMNSEGKDLKQHTDHKYFDVQHPSISGSQIVYQLGADLYLFDIKGTESVRIDISLVSDFAQRRKKWIKNPMDYLPGFHISEKGDEVLLTSRGRVFISPVKQGRFVEVTRKYGIRYKNARFLSGTDKVFMLSDESGEMEYWTAASDGTGNLNQLSNDSKVLIEDGVPSPDGKYIAYTDKDLQLWLLNVSLKSKTLVRKSAIAGMRHLAWSPDSKWLAFVEAAENGNKIISLYKHGTGLITTITTDRLDSYNPAWSRDGKWLCFLSDREFSSKVYSPWGPRQPEPYYTNTSKIYMLALAKDLRNPFLEKDELYTESDDKDNESRNEKEKKDDNNKEAVEGSVDVIIDLEGLAGRLYEVPVNAGNYRNLSLCKDHMYYTNDNHLIALKMVNTDPKPETVMTGIRGYEISGDGKKVLARKGNDLYVFDANGKEPAKPEENKVKIDQWSYMIDPVEEWKQIFTDAWRMERDYFYDKSLHGVDWQGIYQRHLPLVDRVTDREELNNLIAQVLGELSALHIFVGGGDTRKAPENLRPSSLGAILHRDDEQGGYRISHIYESDPDYPNELSPLAQPQTRIQEGDIILAINGVPLLEVDHPANLLERLAKKQVRIKLKDGDTGESFEEIIRPISNGAESNLRYREWEYTRRKIVEEKSDSTIGYVHLRAMGGGNFTEFVKGYYPVYHKQGLIIDVRHNRGGNIDSWVLEKLMRKAWFYWQPREGAATWNMQYAFRGHMVVLCNERTASDGEAFAEGFRRLELGEVIGTRTWGGEVWLNSENVLVDRGRASAAMIGVYGPEGEWLIEGWGVEPDIVIDNLPHASYNGTDAQLEAAIKHLQKLIESDQRSVPEHPPYPDKSFDYE